ncbi:MAG: hypothetical protein V1734_03415 [Nanoarchaeota archaeon]
METKIDGPKSKSDDGYIGANRYISAKKARTIAAVMAGAGMLFGGLGVGASYRMAEREAAQNPLELTCEQLSKQDTSMMGIDGTTYTLKCDSYGTPVLQERGQ